jgi:hypothetical protein
MKSPLPSHILTLLINSTEAGNLLQIKFMRQEIQAGLIAICQVINSPVFLSASFFSLSSLSAKSPVPRAVHTLSLFMNCKIYDRPLSVVNRRLQSQCTQAVAHFRAHSIICQLHCTSKEPLLHEALQLSPASAAQQHLQAQQGPHHCTKNFSRLRTFTGIFSSVLQSELGQR